MKISRSLVAFAFILLFLTSLEAAPVLFYLEPVENACIWKLFHPRHRRIKKPMVTNSCPENIVWDVEGTRTVYRIGTKILERKWGEEQQSSVLVSFPNKMKKITDMWIHAENGNLRIALKKSDDEPELVVFELDENQKWKKVTSETNQQDIHHKEKTFTLKEQLKGGLCTEESCSTEGLEITPELQKKIKDKIHLALNPPEEASTDEDNGEPDDNGAEEAPKVIELSPDFTDSESEEPSGETDEKDELALAYFGLNKRYGLLSLTDFNEKKHPIPPLFICRSNCKQMVHLPDTTQSRLSIAVASGYALVTEEETGNHPIIYKPRRINPLYMRSTGTSAVWLPFEDFWKATPSKKKRRRKQ